MTGSAFDPFDLPSNFDPLGNEGPPPPRRRRAMPVDAALAASAGSHSDEGGAGAGGRLAHLLNRPGQPVPAGGQGRSPGDAKAGPDDMAARLEALEDEVAILTARFDGLHASVSARMDEQLARLVKAVTALLDERLGRRG